jgi:hypothetical protein
MTAIVIGAIAAVVGVVLIVVALDPLSKHRDTDGYYMGDPFTFDRSSYGIISSDIDLLQGRYPDLAADSLLLFVMADPVDVRMQGAATGPGALFMGIAPTSAVNEYLDRVAHDEIIEVERHTESHQIREVEYTAHQGTAPPGSPGAETFWVTSVAGTGIQTLDWTIESGDWTTVVMNADASPGVSAELAFGALPPSSIDAVAWTTLTVGAIALIGGGLLLFFGVRRSTRNRGSVTADSPEKRSAPESEPLNTSPTTG